MKKISQSNRLNGVYLNHIDMATGSIKPDSEELMRWYENYAKNHRLRLAHDLQMLVDDIGIKSKTKVLNLGAIPPIFDVALQHLGIGIVGVDIDPDRFGKSLSANNLTLEKCILGVDPLPYKTKSFDYVIMNEVFEHLNTNVLFLMKEIRRVLKVGGRLYISTPNLKSLAGWRNFVFRSKAYSCSAELYEEYSKLENLGHVGHVREYTPKELETFLLKVGLIPEKVIYRGDYPVRYRWITRLFPRLRPYFSIISIKRE